MCDRLAQQLGASAYLHELAPLDTFIHAAPEVSIVNGLPHRSPVTPNHQVMVFIQGPNGVETRHVRWGWSPVWSMGTRPPLTHLSLKTASSSKAFRQMWREGRVLVAADGWFESAPLTTTRDRARTLFFSHSSGRPVFLAGLAQISEPASGCDGLVLLSLDDTALAGHQRLLALQGAETMKWLDPALEPGQAIEELSGCLQQSTAFTCNRLGTTRCTNAIDREANTWMLRGK